MSLSSRTSTSPLDEQPRSPLTGFWNVALALGGVALVISLGLRGHLHARVRLSSTRWLAAPSAMAVLAVVTIVVTLIGRRREVLGLLGLSGVTLGLAAFWLLLGTHRWAGPVLLDFGEDHGVHIGDFAALLPVSAAAVLAWMALIRSRGRRPMRPLGSVRD